MKLKNRLQSIELLKHQIRLPDEEIEVCLLRHENCKLKIKVSILKFPGRKWPLSKSKMAVSKSGSRLK